MPIEQLIRRPARTLPPDASCADAAVVMRDENIGAVVVSDAGRPLGVVTDRDLAVRVIAPGRDPQRVRLREVMSGDPIFLSGERGLDQVIQTMRDLGIRRVPVVDADGKLRGLVSMDDLLVLLASQLGDLAQALRKAVSLPEDFLTAARGGE